MVQFDYIYTTFYGLFTRIYLNVSFVSITEHLSWEVCAYGKFSIDWTESNPFRESALILAQGSL